MIKAENAILAELSAKELEQLNALFNKI